MELEKPLRDLEKYIEGRIKEALYEAELALKFLEAGMYRNAAGKAFQAFKALLAALAARHRDTLAARHPGVKTTKGGRRVLYVDWLIAVMPTGQMLEVARDLAAAEGEELIHYANTALNLHEFQYNGLDKSGVLSRYTRLASVEEDVRTLASYVAEKARPRAS
ncbi:PaREP1 family protein [Pyrobaculum sp. 3827-6]|uniref:PaREP1 family protein n=1 Tax=Pyrobaculum sp. 3827-6 TaxID=2983604 RepID=UPI0021D8651B|nr:PaREP1 family protein [Pyrobaculum sp. 3827-6]MCU7786757.1 PaREP1 family protein [Pyrobaculum sp. 3827-6]